MTTPTFIVGTGRCGSTMLSNMLREHPKVLSLSEFFALVAGAPFATTQPFSDEPVDGMRFWSIIAEANPWYTFVLRSRINSPEFLYPCDGPAARFSRQTGIPAILMTALPHLTADCDALYDRLRAEVTGWPVAPVSTHYQRFFEYLCDHFGKQRWVERSGGSLLMLEQLRNTFPEARFIHLARDGRDVALSMQKHSVFRLHLVTSLLRQYLGVHPIESTDRTKLDSVPGELLPMLPERFETKAFDDFSVPLPLCGEFWTQQVVSGMQALRSLPTDRVLTLRYEDFFIDPKRQLERFTVFLGEKFVDGDWSARCATSVRAPKSTWRDLPEDDISALTEACRPGFEALRQAGVVYEL
jgi:putative sulfotransferase